MFNLEVIRSKRKSVLIEILSVDTLRIRAPYYLSDAEIHRIVQKKEKAIIKKADGLSFLPLRERSKEEIAFLRDRAKEWILLRVRQWSDYTGLFYSGAKITSARKRFGSCSAKKGLCFSLYLAEYPQELVDYVILHELCHTVEMNHSSRFYALVERFMPDWKDRERALRLKKVSLER